MLQNLQLTPLVCIISPRHGSLIESKTWKKITAAIVSYWRSGRTTASTHFSKHMMASTMDTMHKLQTCLLSSSNPSSYPPPTASPSSPLCILETRSWPPSPYAAHLFPITHKQQIFLLTATNRQWILFFKSSLFVEQLLTCVWESQAYLHYFCWAWGCVYCWLTKSAKQMFKKLQTL